MAASQEKPTVPRAGSSRPGLCPTCGAAAPPRAPFCPFCGARIPLRWSRHASTKQTLLAVLLGICALPVGFVGALATCSLAVSGLHLEGEDALLPPTPVALAGLSVGAILFGLCIWGTVRLLK